MGNLFWEKTPLPAAGSQVCATEGSGLDHGRQLVSSAPLLRCLAAGRHQLALLLPLMAPAVESWDRNALAACDLSHALPVWWAHSLKDLLPHSGAIDRLHSRRLGPLVDGSNRLDNLDDAGGGMNCLQRRSEVCWCRTVSEGRANACCERSATRPAAEQ